MNSDPGEADFYTVKSWRTKEIKKEGKKNS
jgi:hypothetical protein